MSAPEHDIIFADAGLNAKTAAVRTAADYKPIEKDLNTALNIVEAITETIFFHEEEAKEVAARVPPRGSSSKAEPRGNQFIPPSTGEE